MFTPVFSDPYTSILATAVADLPPWAVAVDGRTYLLDTSTNYVGEGRYKREAVDVLQQRNTNNQRDLLLLPQDIWRQQMESWHQGAGQTNLDREESLPARFSDSFGIDPWTRYEFSLLNATVKVTSGPTANKPIFLQSHNGKLVACQGTTLYWWTTTGSAPVTLTVGATDIIGQTYDGDAIITLHTDGTIYRSTNSTTTALYGTFAGSTFIAYVKDYLLIGQANVLKNITAVGSPVTVYTSPITGFVWKGAAEGNNAIYLIGGSGDRYVVHRVGVKQDGTGINPAVAAALLPDGEIGYSIGGYLGFVFIGTGKGVRMATPSTADGDLTLGALIPTAQPVYGFEGQDRFVWATNSQITADYGTSDPSFPVGTVCGLLRMDLSTFTVSASTPAYANDLVAADQSTKTVQSVITWNGLRVFAVNNGGVYIETTTKMPGGWLYQGRVSFSVEDLKTALYAQVKFEPLHGLLAIDMSYDNGPAVRVFNWALPLTIRSDNISLDGQQFSRVDTRYILYRDGTDATKGPTFTRYEFRARPAIGSASRWTLPLINHEELNLNGVPEGRDTTVEFFRLMDLCISGKMFTLQEWGRTYQVVAKDYSWVPEKLNLDGSGWQGVFTLIVEEVR